MKKLFFILAFLIISCSSQNAFEITEGRIIYIEKGTKTGSFEFIDIRVENKDIRFFSDNKNFGHYTYDHLISHQIGGDHLQISYKIESGKNLIVSIEHHDH